MGLRYHPKQGTIVLVRFDRAFKEPEMVKPRLCVVVSKPMKHRHDLCTVVPLSTTAPKPVQPYHCKLKIPFDLPPKWGKRERWVKGDMIYSAGFHCVDLLRLGKDENGKRIYQTERIPSHMLKQIKRCVLNGLSLGELTNHL